MTQIRSWLFSLVLLSPLLLINGAVLTNCLDVGFGTVGEDIIWGISLISLVSLIVLISFCVNTDCLNTHPKRVGIISTILGIFVVYWYWNINLELGSFFINSRAYHFTGPVAISLGCLVAVVIPSIASRIISPNKMGDVFLLVFNGAVFAIMSINLLIVLPWVATHPDQAISRTVSVLIVLLIFTSPGVFQLLTRKKKNLSSIAGFFLLVFLAASLATIIWVAYGGGWAYLDQEMSNGFEQLRQNIVD